MSIFGDPLPHEDDTASSLIHRTGFPPGATYNQMPEVYMCPCCSQFGEKNEQDDVAWTLLSEKEKERRRLMQLDIFDERAKPLPTETRTRMRKPELAIEEVTPIVEVPPPPPTTHDLPRRPDAKQNPRRLIVTVHHGTNLHAAPEDDLSVIVRCGSFEGQTARVPRGKGTRTTWDELFEFPYPTGEDLEVLLVNHTPESEEEQLVGGVKVGKEYVQDVARGDEESLPVMPKEEMDSGYGTVKEGPNGTIWLSWRISEDGQDTGIEPNLDHPLSCTFVVRRLFQYTDNGNEPYPSGVLCVLRDTDDNCSESVLYSLGSIREPTLSPYYSSEGYHYFPDNMSQVLQLNTGKKLGHILICIPKEGDIPVEEEEELLVIAAVPIDLERMYHRGSAVLLIESKSKDDALWGEIDIEWANKPVSDATDRPGPIPIEVEEEALFVTVVRGINLTNQRGEPVKAANVVVATSDMEGATVTATAGPDSEGTQIMNWNQEIRFINVRGDENEVEVYAYEDGTVISAGHCHLTDDNEGVVIVAMHDIYATDVARGEIVISYKRIHPRIDKKITHASSGAGSLAKERTKNGIYNEDEYEEDEEDEEAEEREEKKPRFTAHEHEDAKVPQTSSAHGAEEEEGQEEHASSAHGAEEEEGQEEHASSAHGAEEEEGQEEHASSAHGAEEEGAYPRNESGSDVAQEYNEEGEHAEAEAADYTAGEQLAEPAAQGGRRRPRRVIKWTAPMYNAQYKKPFYPSGNPQAETHLPFEKSTLSKTNEESIRMLETYHTRLVEESALRERSASRHSGSDTPRETHQV